MSLVSAVNRSFVNTSKTKGRNFMSMSTGVNKVLLARNISISLEGNNLDIALGSPS